MNNDLESFEGKFPELVSFIFDNIKEIKKKARLEKKFTS